jgi:hypothetical protein
MTSRVDVGNAEAVVAEQRRRLTTDGARHRAELAKALYELSRTYDRSDRTADALIAAKEGIAALSPAFLQKPQWFAVPMRALIAQYVALAQRSREPPDTALLGPIAKALGEVTRAEDTAEEDEQ